MAYGVAPLLSRGIDGSGEIVVVPELASGPPSTDIRQDLATFDRRLGLPPAKLQVVNTIARSATPYLASDEEVTDTEMVHVIAPGASLDVVLVPQDATSSSATFAAAATKVIQAGVALHAAVISISDEGPPRQVSLPASDPLVLAVGGTILDAASPAGPTWARWRGTAAPTPRAAATAACSPGRPTRMASPGTAPPRGVPDVAANADSTTAMALEYSDGEFRPASGTSASTPLWAGVIALADSEAGQHLGFVNPAIYGIARGPAYHHAFHDVVTGDNSVLWPAGVVVGYNAGPGWDPVTGWGSHDARCLVPLLARAARLARDLTRGRRASVS